MAEQLLFGLIITDPTPERELVAPKPRQDLPAEFTIAAVF